MKKMMVVSAAAALLALSGCSGSTNTTTTPEATNVAAPASSTPTPTTPGAASFGDTVRFPNGMTVSAVATSRPVGAYSSGAVEGRVVVVTTTLTNTSSESLDGTLVGLANVTYGPTGVTAPGAVDEKTTFTFAGVLLPGETKTMESAYGIPAAGMSNVRVLYNGPDFRDQPAVFKGAVK